MKRVFSLMMVFFLLLGLMPQFALPAKAAVNIEKLQFDDHVDLSGSTVRIVDAGRDQLSGAAVVTLSGNDLIATGIGMAKVRIDGVLYEITVESAPISLLLLIGQSNMRGSEGDASQSIICESGKVYSTYAEPHEMTVDNATDYAVSALSGEGALINVNGTTQGISKHPIIALTEEETGIDELKGENGKVKTALYDLSGRRVQKGQKGVFIQNGKVMVR